VTLISPPQAKPKVKKPTSGTSTSTTTSTTASTITVISSPASTKRPGFASDDTIRRRILAHLLQQEASENEEEKEKKKSQQAREKKLLGILPETKEIECRQAFELHDSNGDDKIGLNLLIKVIQCCGLNPSKVEAEKILKKFEDRNISEIDFEEFCKVVVEQSKVEGDPKELEKLIFNTIVSCFDRDKTGRIAQAELKRMLCSMGEIMSEAEVDAFLQMVDDAGFVVDDGLVLYDELLKSISVK